MVAKRGDIAKDLKGKSPAQRDRYLCTTLGLTPGELSGLHTGPVYSRLERGVELIYHGGHENGNRENLSFITTSLLAYLAGVTVSDVSTSLMGRYRDRRKELYDAHRLNPPYIELLRHDVSGEKLPFTEERNVWKGFKPSVDDWRRDVTLPLPPFDRETSQVLGVMWGDGYIQRGRNFSLIGGTRDSKFYDIIVSRMSKLFNLPLEVRIREYEDSISGRRVDVSSPVVDVSSRAVCTWLANDLEFPLGKKENWGKRNVQLPTTHCDKEGLLEGLNASMGTLMNNKKEDRYIFLIYDKDRKFVEGVHRLAKEAGYNPTAVFAIDSQLFKRSWKFAYRAMDTGRLVFLNPRHRQAIQSQPVPAP
ncbi:MAG: hypothetical protein HY362_03635 [Candidatus Aenigmarchaeota archaeon]|nr:hypothetical protein [Candidatus Aenigmarchaeota archaeon]